MMSFFKIKRSTNYIFTFGSVGSGKSTLMASIAKYFSIQTKIQTNFKNKDGNQVIFEWITDLDNNKFPERSRVGNIFEIDLAVGDEEVQQLTFLEMAGEDLEKVDIRKNSSGELDDRFNSFVKQTKLFLLVTDVNSAKKDDLLLLQFFNYVKEKGANVSKVGLVVCKWDTIEPGVTKEGFVRSKMPQTSHWLESADVEEARVFAFSVGKVNNSEIVEVLTDDSKEIAQWLWQILS